MSRKEEISQYRIDFQSCYKEIIRRCLDEEISSKSAIYEVFFIFEAYFESMRELNSDDEFFDIQTFMDIITKEKPYSTSERDRTLGCFIEALIRVGCSKNKACHAVAEWLPNLNPGTLRQAHDAFQKNNIYPKNIDRDTFFYWVKPRIEKAMRMARSEFPTGSKYKDANLAFKRLKNELSIIPKD